MDTTLVTEVVGEATPAAALEREGTLTVLVGADVGATYKLTRAVTELGRSPDCAIPLTDDSVSRVHARILQVGDHYELEDAGSTNGTLVAETQAKGRVRLHDGARVQLGHTLLRFALQDQIDQQASRQIYEMSVRDGLTGVYNRRYLEERVVSEFAFAERHHTTLCVLMCDIDYFKNVNDRHGHHAGDHVLREVGLRLQSSVRTEDVLARYGGEEFAIIARSIDVSGARQFAERVRSIIARTPVKWDQIEIPVTISVGVAHNHSGGSATKASTLVAAADAALYTAKRGGRNRVELAVSPGRYSGTEESSESSAIRDTQKGDGGHETHGPRDRMTHAVVQPVSAAKLTRTNTTPLKVPERKPKR